MPCSSVPSHGVVSTSRAADRRREHDAASAALAAVAADAVNVNNGTDDKLRERIRAVTQPATVMERLVALRPFSSKVDMLQRVNDGQPSARHRIGAKIAQKLHVVGAAANQEPANSNRVSSHASPTPPQVHIRCDLGELGFVDASTSDPWAVIGLTIELPNRYWHQGQIGLATALRRRPPDPPQTHAADLACHGWTASGAGSRFAMDACTSCDLFARCESGHSTRWLAVRL